MDHSIPISALQHYLFCPRQCGYIHIERRWQDNYLTAKGIQLHERVHSDEKEQRGNLRTERGVHVRSETLGIHGQLDLLEIERSPRRLIPVEYKKGKPKVKDVDRVQLCAQAMCLEEMTQSNLDQAALWYWQTRQRQWVAIDESLRALTRQTIDQTRDMIQQGILPPPAHQKGCKACSFFEECRPAQKDHSKDYIKAMFAS